MVKATTSRSIAERDERSNAPKPASRWPRSAGDCAAFATGDARKPMAFSDAARRGREAAGAVSRVWETNRAFMRLSISFTGRQIGCQYNCVTKEKRRER